MKIYFIFRVRKCVSHLVATNTQVWKIYYAYSSLHLIISIAITHNINILNTKFRTHSYLQLPFQTFPYLLYIYRFFATNAHVSLFVCKYSVTFVSLKSDFFGVFYIKASRIKFYAYLLSSLKFETKSPTV